MKGQPLPSAALCRKSVFSLLICLSAFLTHAQQLPSNANSITDASLKAKADSLLKENANSGFIENKGQITDQDGKPNAAVKYLLNMPGLNVQLRADGFSYDTWVAEEVKQQTSAESTDTAHKLITKYHRVDISLEGASPKAQIIAEKPLEETFNLINGHGEFYNIHSYKVITYKDIYPGIDLEFIASKGIEKPVEYNFIVHPGADASLIKMKYNSGSDIALKNGMIEIQLDFGILREKIPASYTRQDGQNLAVQYKELDDAQNLYAFNIPAYDKQKTLVIDPTPNLVWSTYFGGSGALGHYIGAICTGDAGNIYVAGYCTGQTFTATAGAVKAAYTGGTFPDVFLAKFSSSGQRIWATYYGGTNADYAFSLAYDPAGYVYMGGYTSSLSGIATAGSYQPALTGGAGNDLYLAKFNTSGALQWATYYGGVNGETGGIVGVATDGSVYLLGSSNSTGMASGGAYQTQINTNNTTGTSDALLVKFNSSGTRQWATYFGGTAGESIVNALTLDASDNIYIGGVTLSATNIAANLTEGQTYPGGTVTFITKFNPAGSRLWGRYWPAPSLQKLSINRSYNSLYVLSRVLVTSPVSGITSPGAFQTAHGGGVYDLHLSKLGTDGLWQWGTYVGGLSPVGITEIGGSLKIDADGNAYMVFATNSTDSRLASDCSYQGTAGGGGSKEDLVLMKFDPSGTRLWGTFFGKAVNETHNTTMYDALALGEDKSIYVVSTAEPGTIITAGAFQPTGSGTSAAGANGLILKFNEGKLPSNFAVAASVIAPLTQTACSLGVPQTLIGNTVSATSPTDFITGIFYQWQQATSATGPWTDLPGETFKDLTPPTSTSAYYYRRLIKANNGYCDLKVMDSSAVATVNINASVAPVANANGPQWYLCPGNTVTLNGSASGGSGTFSTYQWYVGNATTPAASTAAYTTAAVSQATTFTLKVTDNAGCVDVDQVTIMPVAANAGPDQSFCQGSSGVQLGTAPVAGTVTYSWSVVSGTAITAANFSCTSCAQPVAKPAAATTYQLSITVTRKDGTTCTTTDDVVVTPVAAPNSNASYAGADQTICKGSTVVLGIATDAAVTSYTWTPGQFLSSTSISNPTFNAGSSSVNCPMTYTVTAVKSGCTFQDQVNVSVINSDVTNAGGAAVCGPLWSSQSNESNCGTATYGWALVSGNGTVLSTRNNGADAYLKSNGGTAVFSRTTTVNGITCTSGNVSVSDGCGSGPTICSTIDIQVTSAQGCPKVFPSQDLQLSVIGINSADYNFSWTPANLVDNPAAPVVNITSTAAATVQVVVTNKYDPSITCTKTLAINNGTWSLPPFPVTDKSTCPGTGIAIGAASAAGLSYAWTPATGLNDATISNPVATLSTTASYAVKVTETASGCVTSKTVTVNVTDINYDAGNNRTVCNGGTVTLGSTPPVGSNYSYSWTPTNAAWQNGTDEHSAQPQVLFASASPITFNVVVTDPVTGCTKNDAVTIRASVLAGEYAGAAPAAICPGESAPIGRAAEANAIYDWTGGPTAGLSCTNCANPVASPTTTTNYVLHVSYPGCVSPVTDNVTVTVKPITSFDFTDKTICPSTPTNIGLGGTGNPASIANAVSYSWSPSSGLSCTNCASPNANPQAVTTYTCVVTFANGCTASDNVTVTPKMAVSAKPDAVICAGASAVLGSAAVANVTYSWSPATNLSATNVAQPTANPGTTTIYSLTATGTGPNAGCTITDAVQVTVNAPADFTIGGTPIVCTGNSTSIGFPSNPNMLYQWSPATGVASPNSSTTVVTPTGNTTYRLVQTDLATGCSNYKEINLVVKPNNLSATGGSLTICAGGSSALPLTVNPSGTYSYSWSPVTGLSDPYSANPTSFASTSTNYVATVTDNSSNCQTSASVAVTVLPAGSCNGTDYGDAPASYDNPVPASHGIINTLEIGSAIDAEGKAVSSALANGDDNNEVANDEEGISFLPAVHTATKTVGVLVNSVLNNTGSTAYLVAWIDFNRDGDFDDAGERSAVLSLSSSATASGRVLQFSGFNNGCVVKAGPSYLRLRLTADISGGWDTNPLPYGSRSNGEVEDYSIIIPGTDFGDAPLIYPTARALVNPDLNNDGKPDAAGSVWLGNVVDYIGCDPTPSMTATADDNDGMNDDDGLQTHNRLSATAPVTWDITANSQGPVTGVQWGMWIDWNADGTFDDFKNGSVNTASPFTFGVSVQAPSLSSDYVVRVGVKTGSAFTANDYNYPITNGEWEDYFFSSPLPLKLLDFSGANTGCKANLKWTTTAEENTAWFNVEQSTDGNSWFIATKVQAAGNSPSNKSYSASAELLGAVTNYFRLKMIDADERFTYSKTVALRCDAVNSIIISPNPVKDKLIFSGLSGSNELHIIDNTGRVIINVKTATSTQEVKLGGLTQGIYYAEVLRKGIRVASKKILKN